MSGVHGGHTQYLQGNVQQCAVVIVEGRLEPPQEGQKAAMLKQKKTCWQFCYPLGVILDLKAMSKCLGAARLVILSLLLNYYHHILFHLI